MSDRTPAPGSGSRPPGIRVSEERLLKWFAYDHLPDPLKAVSIYFYSIAQMICEEIEAGPERTVALRKLLESKDAAVRARLHPGG